MFRKVSPRVAAARPAARRRAGRWLANNRSALTLFGAITAALISPVPSASAYADETAFHLVSDTINTSDPFAIACSDPASGFVGTCLYTSSDIGQASAGTNGNPYPMSQTRLFTLPQGADPSVQSNWQNRGVVFSENQLPFVPANSNHLWAPTVAYSAVFGEWILYVPDVTIDTPAGQSTSSTIAIASSSSPFGPFQFSGLTINVPGYASDPAVLQATDGSQWMAYANGDFSNCGGISIAGLSGNMVDTTVTPQQVQIFGIGALGDCGGLGRPYLEGPQIYDTRSWNNPDIPGPYLMIVAAKPDHTPTECGGIPQPNSQNEVIAWATASQPQGPYTYDGLLMCGSSTEWTNQASLLMMPDKTGVNRLVMFYHDGPGGQPNRKVHAECLFYGGGLGMATRSESWTDIGFSSPTFSSCMKNVNDVDDTTMALTIAGLSPQRYVTAENAGAGNLVFNRYAIGPWELFHLNTYNNNQDFGLQSMTNGLWVQAMSSGYLKANSPLELPSRNNPGTAFVSTNGPWAGRGCTQFKSLSSGENVQLDSTATSLFDLGTGAPYFCVMHL